MSDRSGACTGCLDSLYGSVSCRLRPLFGSGLIQHSVPIVTVRTNGSKVAQLTSGRYAIFHLWTNFVCVLYGIFVTNRTNMLELWLLSLLQSSYFSEKTELLHIWTFKKWQITKI